MKVGRQRRPTQEGMVCNQPPKTHYQMLVLLKVVLPILARALPPLPPVLMVPLLLRQQPRLRPIVPSNG